MGCCWGGWRIYTAIVLEPGALLLFSCSVVHLVTLPWMLSSLAEVAPHPSGESSVSGQPPRTHAAEEVISITLPGPCAVESVWI